MRVPEPESQPTLGQPQLAMPLIAMPRRVDERQHVPQQLAEEEQSLGGLAPLSERGALLSLRQ